MTFEFNKKFANKKNLTNGPKTEKEIIEEFFETAYKAGDARRFLVATTMPYEDFKKYVEGSAVQDFEPELIQKYMHEAMLGKFENQQVLNEMAKPELFFKDCWIYPNFTAGEEVYNSNLLTLKTPIYAWNSTLPDAFWRDAKNIRHFYEVARSYLNCEIEPFMDGREVFASIDEVESRLRLARGLQVFATEKRDAYEEFLTDKIATLDAISSQRNQQDLDFHAKIHDKHLGEMQKIKAVPAFDCTAIDYLQAEYNKLLALEEKKMRALRGQRTMEV